MGEGTGSVAALKEAVEVALASRDARGAVAAAFDAIRSGQVSVEELHTRVLGPLLTKTGSEWQAGSKRVWEEHFVSAVIRTIVESLFLDVSQLADRIPRNGRTIVLACPSGEQHDIGLRMLADRLRLKGWEVRFLGADVPTDEIADAAIQTKADVVALTAATHYNLVLLRCTLDRLRVLVPNARIGVGGPAFADDSCLDSADILSEEELGLAPGPGHGVTAGTGE